MDSTAENGGKPVESLIREETSMGQEGEVLRAERKMEAILCVHTCTYLTVGFLDKGVMVYVVLQGKDKKEN